MVTRSELMPHLHLYRPPQKMSWWKKQWESFKRNFPDRSGAQARSFLITLIIFASFMLLTRIYFEIYGIPF
jgi:hypothetical protein